MIVKVKMLTARAGPYLCQRTGDIVSLEQGEAHRLIAAGQAEPVKMGSVENAAVSPPIKRKRGRPRKVR